VKKPLELLESEDAPAASTPLTILETRVFHLAWQGMTQTEIGKRIQRDPRTVSRLLTVIAQKLGAIDAGFLRLRLEAELLVRIPTMTTREVIAALKLYRSAPCIPASEASGATSNRNVQSLLREVLPRGDADPAGA
jgi:DNA-binding CsgD family transcriptional regulator